MRPHIEDYQAKAARRGSSRNSYRTNGDTKPAVGRHSGKKIPNGVTRNGERQPTRYHGVDSDQSATRVGKWAAGIARREADIGLHP